MQAIGEAIKDKKVVIGVIDHHTLQVERRIRWRTRREALKPSAGETGYFVGLRDGPRGDEPSARHLQDGRDVLGTNIVRKELGLPEAESLAADPRFSLATTR